MLKINQTHSLGVLLRKFTFLVIAVVAFLLSISINCTALERSQLAEKLAAGSPWQFTTKYEDTKIEFRFTDEGGLERWHNKKNRWISIEITEGDKYIFKTKTGNTITFELDKNGNPTATHSKHQSTFSSLKNEAQ